MPASPWVAAATSPHPPPMTRSRNRRPSIALAPLLLLSAAVASAASAQAIELTAVSWPERGKSKLDFVADPLAPTADLSAIVDFKDGQAYIRIEYRGMKPAVVFGGDVTSYVLWAVTRDGKAENLGELWVRAEKDTLEFATGLKSFAMIVTGEPHFLVDQPSQMVLYTSTAPSRRYIQETNFSFTPSRPAPPRALDDIKNYSYSGDTALDLLQAEKAHEIAIREGADQYAPAQVQEAGIYLAQARGLARRSKKDMLDYARRSVSLSSEALRTTERMREQERLEAEAAARSAALDQAKQRAESAEGAARVADQARAETQAQRDEVERQMAFERMTVTELRRERQQLALEIEVAQNEGAALRSNLEALEQEKQALEVAQAELRDETATLQADRSGLQGKVGELSTQRAELERVAADLSARTATLETDRGNLEGKVTELTAQRAELERVASDLAAKTTALERDKGALAAETAKLRTEKDELARRQGELETLAAKLEAERDALGNRLEKALQSVAETRRSARGYIVNLPDILFDIDKSDLKPQAQITVAKLTGILSMLADVKLTVEGHTDSTGSAEHNLKLSRARASSVVAFLTAQGIAAPRIQSDGFGFERPIADNGTADGRTRNRRVEVIIEDPVARTP